MPRVDAGETGSSTAGFGLAGGPALHAPNRRARRALAGNVHALLDPATHAVETGYCELPDGTAYVASLVPLPGCTAEMYGWWFWWHGVESARYPLWYPYNHVSVGPLDRELLWRPGLDTSASAAGIVGQACARVGLCGPGIEPVTMVDSCARSMAVSSSAAAMGSGTIRAS
jgi:hypothetical protein